MIKLLVRLAVILLLVESALGAPFLGNGIKIGEVYQDRALVWARLTTVESGDSGALVKPAPGGDGSVSVLYREHVTGAEWVRLNSVVVSERKDFAAQVLVDGLEAGREYEVQVNALDESGVITDTVMGGFRTAFEASEVRAVKGVVVTCQGLGTVDDSVKGHRTYADILKADPDFFVHAGDVVYYDKDYDGIHPLSKNMAMARERWNRMFSYQWNKEFHSHLGSYFMKDDHDVLKDDCYPGQTYGDLTFEEGLKIFKEQTPQGALPYRTIRWGQDVQIWLLEGRDYRSPNRAPDGPEKTMLGVEQKVWLKRTVLESDATFKLVISPSPIVGPDKPGKKDNLSNDVFKSEGDEIRRFLSEVDNLFVVCGDRHWQYASKDAETGLMEMGCGPINNEHAKIGGSPGRQDEHIYFGGGAGGYLLFEVDRNDGTPQVNFRWFSNSDEGEAGSLGRINYEMTFAAE